ncbi:hypothetical protein ACLKA7_009958 [Drosophila subpalustris]
MPVPIPIPFPAARGWLLLRSDLDNDDSLGDLMLSPTSEDTSAIRDGAAAALLFIVMGVLPVPPQDPLPPSLSAREQDIRD